VVRVLEGQWRQLGQVPQHEIRSPEESRKDSFIQEQEDVGYWNFHEQISYLIALWGGCGVVLKKFLQIIQNKVARIVTKLDWSTPYKEVLHKVGWLSVNQPDILPLSHPHFQGEAELLCQSNFGLIWAVLGNWFNSFCLLSWPEVVFVVDQIDKGKGTRDNGLGIMNSG
jgi:hypothetical protein